jgi:uncharacterized membrane protein YbhN (UPF0104 family)
MSRTTLWTSARVLGGCAILAFLVWRLGTGPFLDGLRAVDAWSLAAAIGVAVVTTGCCAWRWRLVAEGLEVPVSWRGAVASYYQSQFLNSTLPGGMLGDVHRAVRHGLDVGSVNRGVRAVAWERSAGLVVAVWLAVAVLLVLPSPVRSSMPIVAAAIVVGTVAAVAVCRVLPRTGPSVWARTVRAAAADLHGGVLARRAWPGILLASALVLAGHVVTFLIAARTAGSTASLVELTPLALLALLAMVIPTSIAGWGPREGAAAWVFGLAGLGAAQGVTTSVVYGVMVLVASLPGAVVIVASARRSTGAVPARHAGRAGPVGRAGPADAAVPPLTATGSLEGEARG